jgi:hypothetical protein
MQCPHTVNHPSLAAAEEHLSSGCVVTIIHRKGNILQCSASNCGEAVGSRRRHSLEIVIHEYMLRI